MVSHGDKIRNLKCETSIVFLEGTLKIFSENLNVLHFYL